MMSCPVIYTHFGCQKRIRIWYPKIGKGSGHTVTHPLGDRMYINCTAAKADH